MERRLRKILGLLMLLAISSLMLSACKKKSAEDDQHESVSSLKTKLAGKWLLIKGLTTEYDVAGKVVRQEDISGTKPIPVYDFRENDIFYLSDYRGEKNFSYMPSVGADGRSKIVIDGGEDYDITLLNKTDMKWFRERKVPDEQPGVIRRAVMEVEFKKQ
ncbi:SH3 domain-containing protein [Pedobacter endophyticus]|uniref:Lipocalin-like domain-containing protein n=1 Tax=Pedobacter endophyticus TaxID=2789740 RepID=A0A7U3SQY7_9SPHI|nr:hypothetical protein [Pedobacter endophyticus]QPH38906.1 hypothetical protein IZT61_17845 [Pedobacter endophyticus]